MTNIVRLDNDKIQASYDGFELYFDNQDKILYSSINALARWTGASPKTIRRVVESIKVGATMPVNTIQGIHQAKLLNESEIKQVLLSVATGSRTKTSTKENAKTLLELMAKHPIDKAFSFFKPVKNNTTNRVNKVNEKKVSQYLKLIHESSGDAVFLEQRIDMGYRPDMIILTPSTGQCMAVEVEPYSRRRYGLQQAVTYAKFSHSKPYLVTFGECEPCEKEQLTLAKYQVAWLHLKVKSNRNLDDSEFISNFAML